MTRRKSKAPAPPPELTPEAARQPLTVGAFNAFARGMGATIKQAILARTDPLGERVAALEARLAEAEARAMTYAGVHQRALGYPRGVCVTAAGGLWIAVRAVEEGELPGASTGWQLCLKGGGR